MNLAKGISARTKDIFEEIIIHYDFAIDTFKIAQDHVHIFLSFAPRYSISKVVVMLKSVGARVIFKHFPAIKKEMWRGELLEGECFARTVADKVTVGMIRNYIKHHGEQEKSPTQLEVV